MAEHVRDPLGFLAAAYPGAYAKGAPFVLTPNRRRYFGLAARVTSWLVIDEAVLALLRPGALAPPLC